MEEIGKILNSSGTSACRMFISTAARRRNSYRNHKHAEFEISLILNGRGVYDTERGKAEILPGDVFMFSTNEYHCITDIYGDTGADDMRLLNLQFSPNFVWSAGNDYLSNGYLGAFFGRGKEIRAKLDRNNAHFAYVTGLLNGIRAEFSGGAYGCDVMVKAKILELLVILRREFFPPEETGGGESSAYALHSGGIERAIGYMDKNFASAITLEEIAKEAYMPRTYFCAVFKKLNGMTPWQYINIRRIDEALRLLKKTDDTVLKIAVRCGFNNTANFNRIFKKITGLTPLEYKKNLKK